MQPWKSIKVKRTNFNPHFSPRKGNGFMENERATENLVKSIPWQYANVMMTCEENMCVCRFFSFGKGFSPMKLKHMLLALWRIPPTPIQIYMYSSATYASQYRFTWELLWIVLSISTWLLLICLLRHSIYIYIYGVTSSSSGLYIWRGEKCDCCSWSYCHYSLNRYVEKLKWVSWHAKVVVKD